LISSHLTISPHKKQIKNWGVPVWPPLFYFHHFIKIKIETTIINYNKNTTGHYHYFLY